MDERDDEYLELISGYLDNELTGSQRDQVEALLVSSPVFKREFDAFKSIAIGTEQVYTMAEPRQEEWDAFLDGVYNRMERRAGWILFWLGLFVLSSYGVLLFFREPWGSALIKLLISVPVAGFLVLFVSVLRQRLLIMKSDRYTKEVHR